MKRILLATALCLLPSALWAQCNGVFPASNVCGTTSAGPGIPGPLPLSSFALSPGGTSGQVQTNNGAGGFAGLTPAQLTALINAFTSGLSGAVPASGGGTVNFLRADGTFAPPTSSSLAVGGRLTLESGQPVPTVDQKPFKVVVLTSGTTWAVPADWNNANNTIEVVGAGGGGNTSVGGGGGTGGGGGAYSLVSNITLSGTVTIQVGAGGAAGGVGTDTYLCNTNNVNCATIAGTAVQVGAKGGGAGVQSGTAAVLGGQAASGVGSTKNSGGNSGTATAGNLCSSGAGGAAGPFGAGGNGGASGTTGSCTGVGGNANANLVLGPAAGTAGYANNIWVLNNNTTIGVGTGAGGAAGVGGFTGGLYGGGSTGGTNGIGGQIGRNGVIVITYLPANAATTLYFAPCAGFVSTCLGTTIPVWSGSAFVAQPFVSSNSDTVGLTHILHGSIETAGSCFDEYVGVNPSGSVVTLGHGPAWTTCTNGSSSRGTGAGTAQVAMFGGISTNAVSMTINYDSGGGASTFTCAVNQCTRVASFVTTVAGGVYLQLLAPALFNGAAPVLGIDNVFNRIEREIKNQDQTSTWNYASGTVHDVNGANTNRITFIDGTGGDTWVAQYVDSWAPLAVSNTALTIGMCVNVDCTTNGGFTHAAGQGQILGQGAANSNFNGGEVFAELSPAPIFGLNTIWFGEQSTPLTTSQFGNDFMRGKVRKKF